MLLDKRLYPGLLFILLANIIVIATALSLPETPWQFSISAQNTLQAAKPGQKPKTVAMFYHAGKQIPAHAHLALDEPDTVGSYQDFNNLLLANSLLTRALKHQQLKMKFADASIATIKETPRRLKDLPGLFWLQIMCGSLAVFIFIYVKAKRYSNPGTNALCVLGFSFMLCTFSAAIYSTRNLIIDGHLLHALSMLNHTGAMLFSAGITALLWNYPKVVAKHYAISAVAFSIVAINIVVDGLQLTQSSATGSYTWTFILFAFGLTGAIVQWWLAHKSGSNNAAVSWLLLAAFAGTAFLAISILLPVLSNKPTLAPQGVLFVGFLIMHACFALGVMSGQHVHHQQSSES